MPLPNATTCHCFSWEGLHFCSCCSLHWCARTGIPDWWTCRDERTDKLQLRAKLSSPSGIVKETRVMKLIICTTNCPTHPNCMSGKTTEGSKSSKLTTVATQFITTFSHVLTASCRKLPYDRKNASVSYRWNDILAAIWMSVKKMFILLIQCELDRQQHLQTNSETKFHRCKTWRPGTGLQKMATPHCYKSRPRRMWLRWVIPNGSLRLPFYFFSIVNKKWKKEKVKLEHYGHRREEK